MRRKSTLFPTHRPIHTHRKSSNSSASNTASALAYAANRNLITMTVGLLSSGPSSSSTHASPSKGPVLNESEETALIDQLCHEIEFLKHRIDRRCLKTSKVCESYVSYFEQYAEFDPFLTPCEPSNPCKTKEKLNEIHHFDSIRLFRVNRLDRIVGLGENGHSERHFCSTSETLGFFHQ